MAGSNMLSLSIDANNTRWAKHEVLQPEAYTFFHLSRGWPATSTDILGTHILLWRIKSSHSHSRSESKAMPADRLLGTLLRALQTYTDQQDTPRLFGTAASLLTTLQNPLNVTLLSSQLVSAPAIWFQPEGLRTSTRCMSVFHSAAQALVRHEIESFNNENNSDQHPQQPHLERTLPKDDWIKAVVKGADEHSPRWRHLLILGGLLLGFGPVESENLSSGMRRTLEEGLVTAANLAVEATTEDDELGQQTIALVLNHCFPMLSDLERSQLNYDALLPILMRANFHSGNGLRSGYFLGTIDLDVYDVPPEKLHWAERSPSFQMIKSMNSGPLTAALGPLSRLIGHTLESVTKPRLVTASLDDIELFAKTLQLQWRQCRLSGVDASEEQQFLDNETAKTTVPVLWKLLRSTLFAAVIVLRSIVGRMLGDAALARDDIAPQAAIQSLNILRHLYFISNRLGTGTFSQYNFVYFTAMDILAAYPAAVQTYLQSIRPTELGRVPQHPLDRNLDLFFLNTAENFTLVVPSPLAEELLVAAATPYLVVGGNPNLMPIFEAAHSVMLACFSAPQNALLSQQHIPFYVEALFSVFPESLSPRQFRLAFKTLIRITSPPAPLAASHPMLPAILLELLNERTRLASTSPLPEQPPITGGDPSNEAKAPLSEQAVIILTITDVLPVLPLDLLEEWLPVVTHLINGVGDLAVRKHCTEHFWQILVNGEMDPERSAVCHAWWTTSGGRESVLQDQAPDHQIYEMSGALPAQDGLTKL